MNVMDEQTEPQSRLITRPNDLRVATPFRSTDATTALTRGLAQYAAGLSIALPGGRSLAFGKSYDAWAEPEDEAEDFYPSFIAYTYGKDGQYEAANLTPTVSKNRYPNGTYEVSGSELAVDIMCDVWATDPEERSGLVLMLEEAFAPVEWMEGFRLELPHYFNQRATFLASTVTYVGDEEDAISRYVKARFIVRGSVPRTRTLGFAQAQPKVVTTVGDSVIVDARKKT